MSSGEARRRSVARRGPFAGRPAALLAELSHELRSPLSTIVIWTELMRRQPTAADTEQGLAAIERSARALLVLAEHLLDLARLLEGLQTLEERPLDLAAVLADAVGRQRPLADARGVSLVLERSVSCTTTADERRLGRALSVLVGDAVRRASRGGAVAVQLARTAARARLRIRLGGGPGATSLSSVRARLPHASVPDGLGFAVAVELVGAHGGSVEFKTRNGGTYLVVLPLHAVEPSPPAPAETESPSVPLEGTRILVVDDVEDVREVLRLLLESWGAVVRTAPSAEEALARVRDFRPHILLSDLSMPGRDGYELMRQVRALPAELGGGIRAAALTARGGLEDRRRALEAGFEEHLLKPVDPPVLRQKLAALRAPRR